jgi:hypothetical protein
MIKQCIIARVGAHSKIAALKASMNMMIECIVEELERLISVQGLWLRGDELVKVVEVVR